MAGTWQEDQASLLDAAETRVKHAALDSFRKYRRTTYYNTTHRRRQNFYSLPQSHQSLLSAAPFNYKAKLNRIDDAIDANACVADAIATHAIEAFGIDASASEPAWQDTATSNDHDKARSTIRQFYRDWSAEGSVERTAAYGPVLEDLTRLFPDVRARDGVKVLVPGAGLGRLLVEIAAAGFEVEGNELSFHQLMASNWVLNGVDADTSYELHPWALTFSNQRSVEEQVRAVRVPDVHPGTYLHGRSEGMERHAFERMGMVAGDFCLLYTGPEYTNAFGVVATVFFIDTAPNLIRYLEAIANVLEEGGYWVNLGPLLWHFEDRRPGDGKKANEDEDGDTDMSEQQASFHRSKGIADPGSMELTAEEVITLISHLGFEVLEHEVRDQPQGYIQDVSSMMATTYKALHFVARRRILKLDGMQTA